MNFSLESVNHRFITYSDSLSPSLIPLAFGRYLPRIA
jgi:hypothetical protein